MKNLENSVNCLDHGTDHIKVLSSNDPDVTVVNVYFPKDNQIQVHQSRVKPCPSETPAGYYWYGKTKKGPGYSPKWVDQLLSKELLDQHDSQDLPPSVQRKIWWALNSQNGAKCRTFNLALKNPYGMWDGGAICACTVHVYRVASRNVLQP